MSDRTRSASPAGPGREPSNDAGAGSRPASSRDEASPRKDSLLPAIAVPKGGGAIRGIGEKFATHPATGTASLSVPISTSPGRAGADLGLDLAYDSGAGNGPFGLSWRLSLPSITRRTDRGLPRYADGSDAEDAFVLSGAEDLVPVRVPDGAGTRLDVLVRGDHRVQRFRPRVEGLFARIERWTHAATGDVHWRAITRDNALSVYGRTASARIADPEHPERVFSWLLEETRDDRGHVIRYGYKAEDGAGVDPGKPSEASRMASSASGALEFLATAQRYIKRIQYGNRTPIARDAAAPVDDDAWMFEVVFDYGEHDAAAPTPADAAPWPVRSDAFSSYRAGFEMRTYRLCRRVLMFHRFAELGAEPCLVRSTDFRYDDCRVRSQDGVYDQGPVASYLTGITQAGYVRAGAGYERATLPTLELGYAAPVIHDQLRGLDRDGLVGLAGGVDKDGVQWVDLDGEGIPGVLIPTRQAWYYKANLGDGRLAAPTVEHSLPVPAELRGGSYQLTDLGSDGNLDLVHYAAPGPGYFERTADRDWAPFVPFRAIPNIDWDDPNLRFIDADGDGLADVLITEQDAIVWYRSRSKGELEPAARVTKPVAERDGPRVVFGDTTEAIQLADMSGDGLIDIVRVRNGEICYWPNLGYGRFGRKVTMDRAPRFDAADQFDARRVRFADIDGSGTSDVIYLGRDGVRLYFNQSGNGLTAALAIASLPAVDSMAKLSVVDLLGSGTSCLVWSSTGPAGHPLAYVDLMGGHKPHLLESMVNNLGSETRIRYAPSTRFYLEDKASGRPWLSRLPFPVHVLERIERIDRVAPSTQVTRFRYHHGFYDGTEREFRGFACVEQWDAESFGESAAPLDLPPVRTVTWFHTGAWLERERLDLALAREFYAGDSLAPVLGAMQLPVGLTTREEREAMRAVRGLVMRQEIYTEDGTAQAAHPYTVSERTYEVRRLQPRDGSVPGVFYAHPRHTVNLLYERDPADPRLEHEVVLAVDEFGNATRTAKIGYPRRTAAEPEQARAWIALHDQSFINRPDELDWRRIGVAAEAVESELTGLTAPAGRLFTVTDLAAAAAAATEIPYEGVADGIAVQRRVTRRERRFYYRDDLTDALPLGQLDMRALLHEVHRQAFTPGVLAEAFGSRVTDAILTGDGRYVQRDGVWWAPSGHAVFSPAAFYAPVEAIDAFGERYRATYDAYALLVLDTVDPLGNHITAGLRDTADAVVTNGNDYRVLAPALTMDPNRNRIAVRFDALGIVVASAVQGKGGAGEGDTLDEPTLAFTHDLHSWRTTAGARPAYVRTRARERHGASNPRFHETFTYFDGTGREVMKKAQAEPGLAPVFAGGHLVRNPDGSPVLTPAEPRWVGTGRTVFDNKGNVVKKYEPFFARSADFESDTELVEWGVTPIFRHDALGRLIRIDQPDGTYRRAVIASWKREAWDEVDTVADSAWLAGKQVGTPAEQRCAALALALSATPMTLHLDPLGRVFLTIVDNGPGGLRAARLALDIEGNQRSVTDERDNLIQRQQFDMLRRLVRLVRADAGAWDAAARTRLTPVASDTGGARTLLDAANKPVRSWDELDNAIRRRYDALQRASHVSVRTGQAAERLIQRTIYGEVHPEANDRNLRTRACRQFDGAGVVVQDRYDVNGNLNESTRRPALDVDEPAWSALDTLVDLAAIDAAAAPLLEAERFTMKARHDALNRVVLRATPDGSVSRPAYNEANLVERIDVWVRGLDLSTDELRPSLEVGGAEDDDRWTAVVTGTDYDARGARVRVDHGNGAVTHLTYDRETFRLVRQRVVRTVGGATLSDLGYEHDPVGNVVAIRDGVSYGNPAVSADGLYTYDALYQLATAEGREHPGQQPGAGEPPGLRLDHPSDLQALRRYRETYQYDAVGNLTRIVHAPLSGGAGWSRSYAYALDSNRLAATSGPSDPDGTLSLTYDYDDAGQMSRMPHLPEMRWDHDHRLRFARKQVASSDGVRFAYDAEGARIRKVYAHGAIIEDTIYVGDYEVYRRRSASAAAPSFERQTLRLVERGRCIALVETKTIDAAAPPFTPTPRWRYQVQDALGSVRMELDADAAVISYEELHPFGTCAFRAADSGVEVSARRYRYTGHERDEETGLDHCGARYYAAWLGRWTSPDPSGIGDGLNLYRYVRNNPLRYTDPSGTDSRDSTGQIDTLRPASRTGAQSQNGGVPGTGSGKSGSGPTAQAPVTPAAPPSRAPTIGPSGTGAASSSGASSSSSSSSHGGVLGVFESIADALGDAASWMREWLPGLVAAPLAGLVDIVSGLVRTLGGIFTWNGSVAVKGLRDMGLGALGMLGLKEALTESWDPSAMNAGDPTTSLPLPKSIQQDVRDASAQIPANAYKNGMHAWHAATNAAVAHRVGPVGAIPLLIAGVVHESPIDWGSFMAEQESQGTINHIIDSFMDIVSNIFGTVLGLLLPRSWAIEVAAFLGNHIPGPGDPNPRGLPGGHIYRGRPSNAWGQYP